MGKFIDLTGRKFGRLKVIRLDHKEKNKNSSSCYWLCECDCGNEKITNTSRLNSESTQSCGCLQKEYASKTLKNHQWGKKESGESSFNSLYRNYKKKAKLRNLPFELDIELFKKLTKQKCYYCNCEPYQDYKSGIRCNGSYIYNGIDRIDSSKGYTIDNCVPCCGRCNEGKNDISIDEFLLWIEKVYNHSIANKNAEK